MSHSDIIPFAIMAFIQIIILICFFVLCSSVEKLVKIAKFVQERQIPALSEQLEQIHKRLAGIERKTG